MPVDVPHAGAPLLRALHPAGRHGDASPPQHSLHTPRPLLSELQPAGAAGDGTSTRSHHSAHTQLTHTHTHTHIYTDLLWLYQRQNKPGTNQASSGGSLQWSTESVASQTMKLYTERTNGPATVCF